MRALRHLDYPPMWLGLFIALAWGMGKVWAPLGDATRPLGWALIAVSLGVVVWAAVHFRRARTTMVPHRPPKALVEDGPFRWSRNPIYLADLGILAGYCLTQGAPQALILLVPLAGVLQSRFIEPEEGRLATLGAPYAAYRARVRRWI